jgi:hypothetical protein
MHPARFASSKSGEPVSFNIFLSEGECLFQSAFGKASTFEVGGCWMCFVLERALTIGAKKRLEEIGRPGCARLA